MKFVQKQSKYSYALLIFLFLSNVKYFKGQYNTYEHEWFIIRNICMKVSYAPIIGIKDCCATVFSL